MSTLATLLSVFIAAAPRAGLADRQPPRVIHVPCEAYQKGRDFKVWARFFDESAVFDPQVIYRVDKAGTWKTAIFLRVSGTDDYKAVIPAEDLTGPLSYFIEVFDVNGNGPSRYGKPDDTVVVMPADEAELCKQIPGGATVTPAPAEPPPQPEPPPPRSREPKATLGPIAPKIPPPKPFDVTSPPPPKARTGFCQGTSPPIYCSKWLWVAVGGGALVAASVTWLVVAAPWNGDEAGDQNIRLVVTGASPTGGNLQLAPRRRP